MMKKLNFTSFALLSVSVLATPAYAACANEASASSTTRSCEGGVAVFRGQINGPDFRIVQLQQQRDIAEARARREEARTQRVLRQQSQATSAPRPTGPIRTGRSGFVFTPFAQNNVGGFGRGGGLNFGAGLNPTGFAPSGFVGSFGRGTTPSATLSIGGAPSARGASSGGRR